MKRAVLAALVLSAVTGFGQESFDLDWSRPAKVGQVFEISIRSSEEAISKGSQEGGQEQIFGEKPKVTTMRGKFRVVDVSTDGRISELHGKVERMEAKHGDAPPKKMIEPNTEVRVQNMTHRPMVFAWNNDHRLPIPAAKVLAQFFDNGGIGSKTSPLGSRKRCKKGETWEIDPRILLEQGDLKLADDPGVKAQATLHDVVEFNGTPCLDLRVVLAFENHELSLPNGMSKDSGESTAKFKIYLPLDPNLPVAGTHSEFRASYEASGEIDGKKSKIVSSQLSEHTTKISLIKK